MPRKKKSNKGRKPHNKLNLLEDIYYVVNQVQTEKKMIYVYFEDENIAITAENILKDTNIEFVRFDKPNKILFKLIPNKKDFVADDISIDEIFDDEIIEEGHLF